MYCGEAIGGPPVPRLHRNSLKHGHAFHMGGMRKHIHHARRGELVMTRGDQDTCVPRQGRRITADIDNARGGYPARRRVQVWV